MNRSAEGRGASVEEAITEALAELGLAREDVTVEVLAEGRRGLFGGTRRAHVRVIANSADTTGEAPTDRADVSQETVVAEQDAVETSAAEEERDDDPERLPSEGQSLGSGGVEERPFEDLSPEERVELLDREAEYAADFVEGLLDMLDLPGDIEIEVHEDQALVTVQDVGSGLLIGRRGATLDAMQELVRSAVQRQTQRRSHVRIDVEGYRTRQLEKLRDKCREAIAEVRETSEPVRLEPMDPYERKMMHDLVAKTGGVTSSSEGNEPKRRVVIHPA